MKDRIGIAIVALVSLLISCLVFAGCTPLPGYSIVDSQSELMQPTFSMYRDPQVQLDIGTIIIWESLHSSEEKTQWELHSGGVYLPMSWHPRPVEPEMVWYLQYEPSDNFIKRLLGLSAPPVSPVSCLTYGEVPPGYQEKVKAGPLEPERYYIVQMRDEYGGRPTEGMTFIIRLNGTGTPERLEYHRNDFLITNPRYPANPRDDLRFY
ncbi:hypothetical protein C6500_11235 [Candidatus Poribacteria bacterium]|nr:MAG: hypothetical protein C6500_11235 [Candidatus Poribacteria bacterium]